MPCVDVLTRLPVPGRRAWVACPRCGDHRACEPCRRNRSCADHWRYLLDAARSRLFLQCPTCMHRWWHDSGFGRDDCPAHLDALPL